MNIKYVLFQEQKPYGNVWRSTEVFEAASLRGVQQAVRAGYLRGEPRWAETEEGELLYGLLADGSEMKSKP